MFRVRSRGLTLLKLNKLETYPPFKAKTREMTLETLLFEEEGDYEDEI